MIEQALSYDVRTVAMREAIDQVKAAANVMRVATHRLISADLQGAVDVASHALYEVHKATDILEVQYRLLLSVEPGQSHSGSDQRQGTSGILASGAAVTRSGSALTLTRTRKGRRVGVDVIPGSVRRARLEAGLSLAEVASNRVTRVAVWYVEQGRTRPSLETLQLIAERTGKPIEFFLAGEIS